MTKRRVSIRGRGAEILFGEPATVEVEPRAPGPAPGDLDPFESEPVVPPVAPGSPDDDLERALFEEARDAVGEPAGPLLWDVSPDPSQATERAFIEEAFAAEEPPEPVIEVPVPTLEATMEESSRAEQTAIHQPPPPEVGDVAAGVLPPRPRRISMEFEMEPTAALDIQEASMEVKPFELPTRELTEEQRQAILKWWGDRRIRELSKEIDDTYDEVRRKVGENQAIATDVFNLLLKARDILLRREAERIAQAEFYVELVHARLKRAAESEAAAKKAQWWLMAWGLLCGIAFVALLIASGRAWFQEMIRPADTAQSLFEVDIFLPAMLWGGIGGAVAVLYSLFKHVGERDFDPQYLISYVGKPFMGLIVGATVYMILSLVVRALGISPAGLEGAEGEAAATVAPGVVYLMAWAAGFKENRLLELVDKAMKQVFGSDEKEDTTPAAPAA